MTRPETPTAAPTPAPSYTPFVTDAARLVRVLFSPGAVFTEQSEKPTFWMPWLLVSVVTAFLSFLQRPFQARMRELLLERAGRTAGPSSAVSTAISVVLTPVGLLLLFAIGGGILYLIVSSLGGETSYRRMLTIVVFAWPLTLLQQILTVVVLSIRGVSAINQPTDLFVSLGADLLLPSEAGVGNFVRFVLAGIGPLQIWALVITAVGVMVLGRLSKGQAWAAAIIYYVIGLLGGAGIASFGMRMMGG